ncbi:MAG: GNAT family N-acetyltransferase [Pseudobacteriovorax sp.]|nr:GNAT family N-acetyltransferase [Pseudobacteriovorax sp.]
MTSKIHKQDEYELSKIQREDLQILLRESFPDFLNQRIYYKQLPHFRLLAYDNETLVGQVGVDHRVIRIGSSIRRIFGIIDLCTKSEYRGQGIARDLLQKLEGMAQNSGIDCLILFADDQRIYKSFGFNSYDNKLQWLAINEHQSLSVKQESLGEYFMVKVLGANPWNSDDVDLLGYMF